MAIQGNAYTKTNWAFGERPVASAKLNTWDDRIEAALELAYFLLSQAWGGGDGVLRNVADELQVEALDPPGMSVVVLPGYAFISNHAYKLAAQLQTVDVTPPVTEDRIDLVQARLDNWDVSIKTGTESATPMAPSADADAIPLAEIYLRPSATTIRNTDDSINGYIIDARQFL
jgi:hypothetical protein